MTMAKRSFADFLNCRFAAHDDRAFAGVVSGANARPPQDRTAGREIWPGDDLIEFVD